MRTKDSEYETEKSEQDSKEKVNKTVKKKGE